MRQTRPRLNVVLNPARGRNIRSERAPPSRDLAPFVEAYWTSSWNLPEDVVHRIEMLTDASGHLVFERGASNVVGVVTRRFSRELTGRGCVVGIKLKVGALRAATGRSALEFTDRRLAIPVAASVNLRRVEADIFAARDSAARFALAEEFLRAQLARVRADRWSVQLATIQTMLATIERDFETLRIQTLAQEFKLSPRSLQRLFSEHVGAKPKWVVQRQRLLQAAERLQSGEAGNLAELAASLGYFDQAHFAREFSAIVGRAPADFQRGLLLNEP